LVASVGALVNFDEWVLIIGMLTLRAAAYADKGHGRGCAESTGIADRPPYDPIATTPCASTLRLPDGQVAPFEKIARPIKRLDRIIGLER
jgi:hypothetical protein